MCAFLQRPALKHHLQQLVQEALTALCREENLQLHPDVSIKIEKTRDARHGDFATNIAMLIAAHTGDQPRELAHKIIRRLPASDRVTRAEIAGPGFINFFLGNHAWLQTIAAILKAGESYGRSSEGAGQRILLEYVSANPTGPLHIGHGRGAAYGAATANLLEAIGYRVDREYYVNDAGRQMDILAVSVWLRYLQLCGQDITLPDNAYQGEYIKDIARKIHKEKQTTLAYASPGFFAGLHAEADDEKRLDRLIEHAKKTLGVTDYQYVFDAGLNEILADIEQDLREFGVTFTNWYSERGLLATEKVRDCITLLKNHGHLYEKDGALWFQSTTFGDEKDRVVVRENGQLTYFASDIAYHHDKFARGYARAVDIWGADHHGYMARIKATLTALGDDPGRLDILLVQFATLYRGTVKIQMSTRSGQFVTLRELREEVGKDATRFFYIMRKSDQHLDFDLELAKSQSQDNPVYYIQYAHARICSVLRQMGEKGMTFNQEAGTEHLVLLVEAAELKLQTRLADYPEVVRNAAVDHAPHQLGYYLRDLANDFHGYYNACQILVDDDKLRNVRLCLICAVRQVLRNGLELLGVSAPETM
jgi:arginyl-tRNA synthetase